MISSTTNNPGSLKFYQSTLIWSGYLNIIFIFFLERYTGRRSLSDEEVENFRCLSRRKRLSTQPSSAWLLQGSLQNAQPVSLLPPPCLQVRQTQPRGKYVRPASCLDWCADPASLATSLPTLVEAVTFFLTRLRRVCCHPLRWPQDALLQPFNDSVPDFRKPALG